jgi:hypothetical protein
VNALAGTEAAVLNAKVMYSGKEGCVAQSLTPMGSPYIPVSQIILNCEGVRILMPEIKSKLLPEFKLRL